MLTFGHVSHTELRSQRELPGLSLSALKDCLYNFYYTGMLLFSFFFLFFFFFLNKSNQTVMAFSCQESRSDKQSALGQVH